MRSLIIAAALTIVTTSSAFAGQVWLTMDQVRPFTLEKPADSIVIGNPSIADVTVQDKTRVLLFGKAPGLTNIYIFDENGEAIDNLIVRVKAASSDMLTFHRGAQRTTYNCTDKCEATITVGDSGEAFDTVSAQVQQKLSQAKASATDQSGGGAPQR